MFPKLLLLAMAAGVVAFAQGGGDMGGAGGGGGRGGGDMGAIPSAPRVQKQTPADIMADRLKLNKDQKIVFESIMQTAFQDAAPIRQQLGQGRGQLAQALIDGKGPDEINQITKTYVDAEAKMASLEVQTFQKIYATLKPNQTTKAPQAFDVMGGIFDPAGQSGRGRGMGGGMGGGMGRGRGGR